MSTRTDVEVRGETRGSRAQRALHLVQVAPARSLRLAEEAVSAARAGRDPAAESVAQRALGLARIYIGDLDDALSHLRQAVRLARRAADAVLVAQARMSLAFALGRRGHLRRATREIEAVLTDVDGVLRARALVQRAAIHHLGGRHDDALAGYRRALPVLRQAGDLEWVQRALANRAVVHTFRQSYTAARTDLSEAARLCDQAGLALSAAFVQENLAFVHAQRGDVPAALRHLDDAERRYRALGSHTGSLLVDRSQLLLSVGLVFEARLAAEQAVAELSRNHRQVALPEARLLLARAAALDDDHRRALDEAQRAERAFTRQRRSAWAALARLQVLTARLADPAATRAVRPSQSAAVADVLDAAGWSGPAGEARLLAGRLALDRGNRAAAREYLRAVSRRRRRGPAAMRAHSWYAEALLRFADSNDRGTVSAVRAGLRILDDHQASLGATDLRAAAAGRRGELTRLAMRVALRAGSAERMLRWAERGRAQRLLHTLRPPDDPVLARYLAALRATVADIEGTHRAGGRAGKLLQRQAALERRIRDHCRQQPGDESRGRPPALPHPESLSRTLGDAALVEFVELDAALLALTLVDGHVRLHRLGAAEQAHQLADALSRTLHHLVTAPTNTDTDTGWARVRRHATALDALLLLPLTEHLGDRPLVLVPTGALQAVPWSTLPSCSGRPVTLAPSAALWSAAAHRHGDTETPETASTVLAVAGPGLPGAAAEIREITRAYGTGSIALSGSAATVRSVGAALGQTRVAHFATHGRIRGDNPLFSSLQLADGPLTVYDLEHLDVAPHTVVLAACDAGRSVVRAGDEPLGLSAAFLGLGTRQIVAAVVPVPDGSAGELMACFHRLHAGGTSAAEALARTQSRAAGRSATIHAAAAGFVCMGAGLALPRDKAATRT